MLLNIIKTSINIYNSIKKEKIKREKMELENNILLLELRDKNNKMLDKIQENKNKELLKKVLNKNIELNNQIKLLKEGGKNV